MGGLPHLLERVRCGAVSCSVIFLTWRAASPRARAAYPRSLHLEAPTWLETVPQLARRLSWTEPGFELEPFIADDIVAPGEKGENALHRHVHHILTENELNL